MRVVWNQEASAQLETIFEAISRGSEIYARKTVDRLVSRVDDLGDFPEMGRIIFRYNDPSIRELIVSPYIVKYLIGREYIEILTVVHAAQNRN